MGTLCLARYDSMAVMRRAGRFVALKSNTYQGNVIRIIISSLWL